MKESKIMGIVTKQKEFFFSGKSRDLRFRLNSLKKLKDTIIKNEQAIVEALEKDLKKPRLESYTSEIGFIISEINYSMKNLNKWARRESVKSPLNLFPSRSYIIKEPYGVALIIGPWNYPFQLTMVPLIGAIAAGNCCVVKPSELSRESAGVIRKIIYEAFDMPYITVVEGGIEVSECLLEQNFDKIFFTGSPSVGKIVMEKAARKLIPVTLELGGKSPCIVDKKIDIDIAAKRILWGKFFNAGQTCVAPDYLLVNNEIKEALYDSFKKWLSVFFTEHPENSPDFSRIINKSHFIRLKNYVKEGKIIIGGQLNESELYIAPTIIEVSDMNSPMMQEEIFGPILPVVSYSGLEEVKRIIRLNPNPLGFYIFSNDKKIAEQLILNIPFGGGCVNDTLSHLQNQHLPFGGIGNSGIGNYHGKYSFDAFSHRKSILEKGYAFDLSMKYPPYKNKHVYLKKLLLK
ncbi:aldehyde dehydrogenase [Geosporobacter ferrireducens]|uniref:aldehyde dehydrogenase n=1 Tax=Geosporobacter ferrireducens TaxID=1424294 RepID=UPI00139BDA39|nr:aldehyde dehydrogenase [Geosporobacter ferrireducens]MTI55659.1 aldehyde dehydrogenase [Geosporobacter ferrireducens]